MTEPRADMTAPSYVLDKSKWGDGPWMDEPDKLQWRTEAGLPGLIVRNDMGNLCGYVAVNRGHTLYEKDYDEPDVEVHGGLTYADHCHGHICHVPEPGEPDDVWWFGFDCAHAWDIVPYIWNKCREISDAFLFEGGRPEVYRDIAYVRSEVESLARQLAAAR